MLRWKSLKIPKMLSKDVLWRAHGSGAFMTNKQGSVITDKQLTTIDDYRKRNSGEGRKLTDNQQKELEDLETKLENSKIFQLSDTAKSYVEKTWLNNEKGIYKDIESKFIEKGLFQEEAAITLLTKVYGELYEKNTERKNNGIYTGVCDVFKKRKLTKIVRDTKCSWDAVTFMNSAPTLDNEYQGRVYMELWDADEFHLDYCLLDCPPHLVTREKERLYRKYYDNSMSEQQENELLQSLIPMCDQIERNLVYSQNPKISLNECVKTFVFYRDDEKMKELDYRQEFGRQYYDTIKLNNIRK